MKQTFTRITVMLLVVLLCVASVQAATTTIDAPIREVTVYADRARVTRVAELNLEAGEHSVLIEGLPVTIDPVSLRTSAVGVAGITLLGQKHRDVQHIESPQEKVAELSSQIAELVGNDKQQLLDRKQVFEQQKGLLVDLGKRSGETISEQVKRGKLEVADWDAAFGFIGDKLRLTNDSLRIVNRQLVEIDKRINKLKKELGEIGHPRSTSSRTVEIDLHLQQEGEVKLSLEYVARGASWRPLYDARRSSADGGKVTLSYDAEVTQKTGEDWDDVKLTLSTATPSKGTGPGILRPWSLSVFVPCVRGSNVKFETSNQSVISKDVISRQPVTTVDQLLSQVAGVVIGDDGEIFIRGGRAGEELYEVDGVPIGDPLGGLGQAGANLAAMARSNIFSGAYTTVFNVQRNETIPSGAEAVRTRITQLTLEAKTEYVCKPKLRQSVYRLVKITNSDDVPLLPGSVAMFADADFIGKATLRQRVSPSEQFELAFGADDDVEVTRKTIRSKKGKKGDKIKIARDVRIQFTNNAAGSRTIRLEEALPVSRDDRIKIKLDKIVPEPTTIDEATGMAVWTVDFEPGEKRTVGIRYQIEYARDLRVSGL